MKNPLEGILNIGKKTDTDGAVIPQYTGDQDLEVDTDTGEVRSEELRKIDETFDDR